MKTWIAHGKTGVIVDIKDANEIQFVSLKFIQKLTDPAEVLQLVLCQPNSEPVHRNFASATDKVGIVYCNSCFKSSITKNVLFV